MWDCPERCSGRARRFRPASSKSRCPVGSTCGPLISPALTRLTWRYTADRTRRLTLIRQNTTPGGMACKLTAAFEGSRRASDAGVIVFAVAETDQMRHRRFYDGRDRFG